MDRSFLQQLWQNALPVMQDVLCVTDSRVDLHFAALKPKCAAECELINPYRRANLTGDPAKIYDEADAYRLLRHELLHVVLGEFDVAGVVLLALAGINEDTPASAAFDRAWTLAQERTVERMERLLDGLGWTAVAMAGRETTCSGCSKTWRAAVPEGVDVVTCLGCGERVTHGRLV